MGKIQDRYNHLRKVKHMKRPAWSIARNFYDTQMIPLLQYINNKNTEDPSYYLFKKTFEKYLIISCVSLIEKFMMIKIRNAIDVSDIDISSIKVRDNNYQKMQEKYPTMTKGEFVVIQSDFTNANNINEVTTCVLNNDNQFRELKMDFFKAVKKIDWYDPYKYVKGARARAIFHNFSNFRLMFELRKKIIHEMTEPNVTYYKIATFCDNTMNFLDAADFILNIQVRDSVIQRLQSKITLRQRNAIIDSILRKENTPIRRFKPPKCY